MSRERIVELQQRLGDLHNESRAIQVELKELWKEELAIDKPILEALPEAEEEIIYE